MDSFKLRLLPPACAPGPTALWPRPALVPATADVQRHPESPAALMLAACRTLRRAGDDAAHLGAPPASKVRPARPH